MLCPELIISMLHNCTARVKSDLICILSIGQYVSFCPQSTTGLNKRIDQRDCLTAWAIRSTIVPSMSNTLRCWKWYFSKPGSEDGCMRTAAALPKTWRFPADRPSYRLHEKPPQITSIIPESRQFQATLCRIFFVSIVTMRAIC